MRKPLIALAFVIAAVVAGGVLGWLRPEIAVAGYFGIVALASTFLVLTSRPAPAPVGTVPRRGRGIGDGVVVRAAAGSGGSFARA
jgi:hypothetical protein